MTKNQRDAKIQREVGTDGEPKRQKEAETQIDRGRGDRQKCQKREKEGEGDKDMGVEVQGLRDRTMQGTHKEACPGEDN